MADARATNPLVEQFRRGGVARDLRLMAAQGLLPLKPEDLLELWTDLVSRPRRRACATPPRSRSPTFPAAELHPDPEEPRHAARRCSSWAVTHRTELELREAALQNTSLPDETIEALAPDLPAGARRARRHQPDAPAAAHARCSWRSRATRA